jgi:hypothetical protein
MLRAGCRDESDRLEEPFGEPGDEIFEAPRWEPSVSRLSIRLALAVFEQHRRAFVGEQPQHCEVAVPGNHPKWVIRHPGSCSTSRHLGGFTHKRPSLSVIGIIPASIGALESCRRSTNPPVVDLPCWQLGHLAVAFAARALRGRHPRHRWRFAQRGPDGTARSRRITSVLCRSSKRGSPGRQLLVPRELFASGARGRWGGSVVWLG